MTFPSSTKKTFSMARIFWQKDFPRSRDLGTYSLMLYCLQYEKQRVIKPLKNRILRVFIPFLIYSSLLFGFLSSVLCCRSCFTFLILSSKEASLRSHPKSYQGLFFHFVWCFFSCLGFCFDLVLLSAPCLPLIQQMWKKEKEKIKEGQMVCNNTPS